MKEYIISDNKVVGKKNDPRLLKPSYFHRFVESNPTGNYQTGQQESRNSPTHYDNIIHNTENHKQNSSTDGGNGKYNFCFITLLISIENYLVICLIQTNIIGS